MSSCHFSLTANQNQTTQWACLKFTDSPMVGAGLWCGHLPTVETCWRSVPVMIKAFITPLKKSIPRLELLGCLALARVYVTCVKALEFSKAQDWERFFWIDSTVLSYIRTPPRKFRPFVSARVAEIQETIGADQIRYIKSNNNPADALTRGIHLNHLKKWSEEPSFLELTEEKWPSAQDHTRVYTHVDDLDALREKKTFRKEKKAGKHHSAAMS